MFYHNTSSQTSLATRNNYTHTCTYVCVCVSMTVGTESNANSQQKMQIRKQRKFTTKSANPGCTSYKVQIQVRLRIKCKSRLDFVFVTRIPHMHIGGVCVRASVWRRAPTENESCHAGDCRLQIRVAVRNYASGPPIPRRVH